MQRSYMEKFDIPDDLRGWLQDLDDAFEQIQKYFLREESPDEFFEDDPEESYYCEECGEDWDECDCEEEQPEDEEWYGNVQFDWGPLPLTGMEMRLTFLSEPDEDDEAGF